ncbi:MAG: DUF2842 domain-containing protein [Novosphingobium sp.]
MRKEPTWRIPVGILVLMICLALYAMAVASAAEWIGQLHVLLQVPIYIVLGTIWIMPLRRYLKWMETGHWR